MSAMSAIATAMMVHNIPEEQAATFLLGVTLEITTNGCSVDEAIAKMVPHFEVELCGDCLIPAIWDETKDRYTCEKCGA